MKEHSLFVTLPVLLLMSMHANAQNLVPNPSFEDQTECPLVSEIELAPPWNSATLGTPDLFNSTCPSQNSQGHTGIGSAGVFLLGSFDDNREYLQVPLTAPLQAGTHYCVSAWVRPGNFRFVSDRLGFYFSPTELNAVSTGVLPNTPQVQNPAGNVMASSTWQLVNGGFTANGGEAYLIIGSFSNDASTTTQIHNASSTSEVAYYYIDDVEVTPCVVGIEEAAMGTFDVYPQPAADRISVNIPEHTRLERVELYDMSGRMLMERSGMQINSGVLELDVAHLPAGLGNLVFHTDKGISTKRIMIAR